MNDFYHSQFTNLIVIAHNAIFFNYTNGTIKSNLSFEHFPHLKKGTHAVKQATSFFFILLAPGNHSSTFNIYKFAYFGYFIYMEFYKTSSNSRVLPHLTSLVCSAVLPWPHKLMSRKL